MMTTRQAVVFAMLMEEGEGILSKAPSYVEEKLTACESLPDNLLLQVLHPTLRPKYHEYIQKWYGPKLGGKSFEEFLETPVLNVAREKGYMLSLRIVHTLEVAGIETVGDLLRTSERELLKYRNFGKKSLAELNMFLGAFNLRLARRESE